MATGNNTTQSPLYERLAQLRATVDGARLEAARIRRLVKRLRATDQYGYGAEDDLGAQLQHAVLLLEEAVDMVTPVSPDHDGLDRASRGEVAHG